MAARGTQHRSLGRIKGLVAAAWLVIVAVPAGASETGPHMVIDQVNATLLEAMQNADRLGYRGRYDLLEPVLTASFDFPFMARVSVGRTWGELDDDERTRLVERFTEMSVANFAARFDGYGGERFEIVGEGEAPRDAVLIETRIVRPDDDPVGLNYVLRPRRDDWRIIDILLDAKFSELARYRSEFGGVLEDGGLPALLATLDDKILELSGGD